MGENKKMGESLSRAEFKAREEQYLQALKQELETQNITAIKIRRGDDITLYRAVKECLAAKRVGQRVFDICNLYYGFSYPFVDYGFSFMDEETVAVYSSLEDRITFSIQALLRKSKGEWVTTYAHELKHKKQWEQNKKPLLYKIYSDKNNVDTNGETSYIYLADEDEADAVISSVKLKNRLAKKLKPAKGKRPYIVVSPLYLPLYVLEHLKGKLKFKVALLSGKLEKKEGSQNSVKESREVLESLMSSNAPMQIRFNDQFGNYYSIIKMNTLASIMSLYYGRGDEATAYIGQEIRNNSITIGVALSPLVFEFDELMDFFIESPQRQESVIAAKKSLAHFYNTTLVKTNLGDGDEDTRRVYSAYELEKIKHAIEEGLIPDSDDASEWDEIMRTFLSQKTHTFVEKVEAILREEEKAKNEDQQAQTGEDESQ